jgi:hypothetical protein
MTKVTRTTNNGHNKPDAPNPAIASRLHSWSHWRGVGDPKRSALMRIALPTILVLVLVGCSTSKRGDIIDVRDIPSPDGRYVFTVFGEIFYDTTGYPRHIYLRRAGEERGYPGNVYIVHVGDDVTVSWTSPTNLSVSLSFETRHAIPAATNVAGVSVSFSEMTR